MNANIKKTALATLKVLLWTLAVIVVIALVAVSAAVWYLSPERLTGMVEKYGTEYLQGATVEASRVEISFWHTFPQLTLEVDSLHITSHALDSLPAAERDSLPAYTHDLLSLRHMHGSVNVLALLKGDIRLHDVLIDSLAANVVVAPSGRGNYEIFPPSADDADTTATHLPSLTIDRFQLVKAGPLRYTSMTDSLDITARIDEIALDGAMSPLYNLSIEANAASPLLDEYAFTPVTIGLGGGIHWNPDRPDDIALNDITLGINEIGIKFSTSLSVGDPLEVRTLDFEATGLEVNTIASHLPGDLRRELEGLESTLAFKLDGRLTRPWSLQDSLTLPSLELNCRVDPGTLDWRNLHITDLHTTLHATVDGLDPDASTVTVDTLSLQGRALSLAMSGKLTHPVSDPTFEGFLDGNAVLQRLPRVLTAKLPARLQGRLSLNTALRARMSDFTRENFHRLYFKGDLTIRDLDVTMRDTSYSFATSRATIHMGTADGYVNAGERADSLLTLSMRLDTATVHAPGVTVTSARMLAGLGTGNRRTSSDTSRVNPFGGILAWDNVTIDSPGDSLRVRLRQVRTTARLMPMEGADSLPRLQFNLDAGRVALRTTDMGMAIINPLIDIDANLMPRVPADTTRIRGRRHINGRDTIVRDDVIDWNLSAGLKRIMRRWEVHGTMQSRHALVFTRSYPVRQRASNIDIEFTTDSVVLKSLHYTIGNSRMDITGRVSNMERALAGRSGRSRLRLDLDINAPYIDINELSAKAFSTTATTNDAGIPSLAGPDADYTEDLGDLARQEPREAYPIIIPRNISANLRLTADTVLYADMYMNRLLGNIKVDNSAVNLSNLSAVSDIGSLSLSALYWAPDTTRMEMGMGMKLHDFNIHGVLRLIPAVDSLLPALRGFAGIIDADLAATARVSPTMDLDLKSFKGALKINGDSLVLLDADTFKSLSKWLMFKNKKRNMIDHMSVEMTVDDSEVQIFPFIFDIDRYRLGVMGHNDLDMNLDYHVSVLKSPLPFKFGINIKGPLDHYKIRLGGAKITPRTVERIAIADSTRINLLDQINEVFRRGSMSSGSLRLQPAAITTIDTLTGSLSQSDSLLMMREGFIAAPDTLRRDSTAAAPAPYTTPKHKKRRQ